MNGQAVKNGRWRDSTSQTGAFLMCLLLDHGLRASEVAGLTVTNFDTEKGELRFYRPKTAVSTTHKLTADTCEPPKPI